MTSDEPPNEAPLSAAIPVRSRASLTCPIMWKVAAQWGRKANERRRPQARHLHVMWKVKGRKRNRDYRTREHLTGDELGRAIPALRRNRHGHRDHMIALVTFLHGLRVSELIDLRWD